MFHDQDRIKSFFSFLLIGFFCNIYSMQNHTAAVLRPAWTEQKINKRARLDEVARKRNLARKVELLSDKIDNLQNSYSKLYNLLYDRYRISDSYSLVTCILTACNAVNPDWKDVSTYKNKLIGYQKEFDPSNQTDPIISDACYLTTQLASLIHKLIILRIKTRQDI